MYGGVWIVFGGCWDLGEWVRENLVVGFSLGQAKQQSFCLTLHKCIADIVIIAWKGDTKRWKDYKY